jgi:hypothetical protein
MSISSISFQTAYSGLSSNPYRDSDAGGVWGCGNIQGWGAAPSYKYEQFCAACPPCTSDRFSTRQAMIDSFGPGCATVTDDYISFQDKWGLNFQGPVLNKFSGSYGPAIAGVYNYPPNI